MTSTMTATDLWWIQSLHFQWPPLRKRHCEHRQCYDQTSRECRPRKAVMSNDYLPPPNCDLLCYHCYIHHCCQRTPAEIDCASGRFHYFAQGSQMRSLSTGLLQNQLWCIRTLSYVSLTADRCTLPWGRNCRCLMFVLNVYARVNIRIKSSL